MAAASVASTASAAPTAPTGSPAASLPSEPVPLLHDPDQFEFFWETSSVFSQWHKCAFVIDGVDYCMAEQYMMAGKARLFQDSYALGNILRSRNARDIKNFGREVKGFVSRVWEDHCQEIAYEANLAKFQQNAECGEQLLATEQREIVEAAPNDRVWGIGMVTAKALVTPRDKWGANMLGKILMRVREQLRASTPTPEQEDFDTCGHRA